MVISMEINLKKLKKEYYLLNSFIKRYEENMLNYYGKMNYVLSEWNDKEGLLFSEHLDKEKKSVFLLIGNLKELCNIYEFIIKKYDKFGNIVKFDFDKKEVINASFDKMNNDLSNIITKFDNLDFDFSSDEKKQIINQKEKLINLKKNVFSLKNNNNKTFDMIDEIEREINYKISKISIENIKETNISDFI